MSLQPQPGKNSASVSNPYASYTHDDLWQRLSANPQLRPTVRASDADRDVVREALSTAYTEGRLTHDEHVERLDAINQVRTVGELVPLVEDIYVPTPNVPPRSTASLVQPRVKRGPSAFVAFGGTWLTVAIITNVVWLITSMTQGLHYYWPIWPMFGMAIPLLMSLIFSRMGSVERDRQLRSRDRERRRLGH